MQENYKGILLKLLSAIDYSDDREVFAKEFAELVSAQAVGDLISALPQDQQDALKSELETNKDNPEKIAEILKGKFSEEELQQSMEDSTKKIIEDWMREITPTLSDEQRQKLQNLSQELSSTPPPAQTT